MAKISQLKDPNTKENIYPVTTTDGIYLANGTPLTSYLNTKANIDASNLVADDIAKWRAKLSIQSEAKLYSTTGQNTDGAMTQKATTDELNTITTALSNKFTNHSQSAYNCNTCYDEGVYLVANGSNCPSGTQYGSLFVMPYRKPTGNAKPDFCTQIFIPNGDDSTDPNSMFYRTSLADSWNNWQKVATTNTLFDKIYPVDSIYLTVGTTTTGSVSPASFFGGSWERLPDGYALWTAASGAGGTIPAGLPNITGTFIKSAWFSQGGQDGAFSNAQLKETSSTAMNKSSGNYAGIKFDANNGATTKGIYGNSTTVQPPAYKVYAWRRVH